MSGKIINKFLLYTIEYFLLTIIYGLFYYIIECIWKQSISDWRMFVLGGILAVLIGMQNNIFSYNTNFLYQMIFGSLIITLCEAILGYQWNTIEGLGLWDYTNTWIYGVNGNVSLLYSVFAWCSLSGVCIILDDCIWYYLLRNGETPYYRIGKKVWRLPERMPKRCCDGE